MGFLGMIGDSNKNLPDEFKDPFRKDAVDRVIVEFHKNTSNIFRSGKHHKATVYFSNGNTKGEQDFFDDNPKLLMERVEAFIEKL